MRILIILWSFLVLCVLSCQCQNRAERQKLKQLRSLVVDKSATKETLCLFDNLLILTNSDSALIGQHEGLWPAPEGEPSSHFEKIVERNPSLLGKDFMHIINNRRDSSYMRHIESVRMAMQMAYRRGSVNVMCWHYFEPEERASFYTEHMTPEKKNRLFRSILPGGTNHNAYKEDLQQIADFSKSLVADNGELIPYIFRPFHEFDGEWFWWGADYSTPEEFQAVWQFTVHYLRDTLGVHNILYAFSPDIKFDSEKTFLARYPGDDYVDLIGFDDYYDFKEPVAGVSGYDYAKKRVAILSQIAKERNKVVALTETGYFIKKNKGDALDAKRTDSVMRFVSEITPQVAFVMFWSNGGSYDYCVPLPTEIGAEAFRKMIQNPNTLLENEYKFIYQLNR